MLRISRRAGEKLRIGDEVVVEVVEISGNMVRLAIDAPRSIPVYREELWLSIKEENEAAGRAASMPLPPREPG